MDRRALLKLIGVSPVAATVAAQQGAAMLTGRGLGAVTGLAGVGGVADVAPSASSGPVRFTDFFSWFKEIGRAEIERQAKYVDGFDADIVARHLPLATKVRLQRERNYARIKEERRQDIEKRIGLRGFAEWWP